MKDISTVAGILAGFALIIFAMVFSTDPIGINIGAVMNFVDPASIFIVIGGVFASVFASYPISTLKKMPKHLKIVVSGNRYEPVEYINTLVEFSQIARKNGLLALEEKANQQEDPFFKQSIMLIVDATDPEKVKTMLENDLEKLATRHEDAVGIYEKASAMAPAFGMIGTLVGLVNMLKNMSMDAGGSSTIGKDMGTALITTFYSGKPDFRPYRDEAESTKRRGIPLQGNHHCGRAFHTVRRNAEIYGGKADFLP